MEGVSEVHGTYSELVTQWSCSAHGSGPAGEVSESTALRQFCLLRLNLHMLYHLCCSSVMGLCHDGWFQT